MNLLPASPTPAPRLSTDVEEQLTRCVDECAAQVASMDDLSERLAAIAQLVQSSDAVPEPVDDDEDSLVYHVDNAVSAASR